jgi:cytochrome c biogenesis protein CcmG, thiol:disulfide interchange protein DsbE
VRTIGAGKWLVLMLLGAVLLTTAGCFGGTRNFSPDGGSTSSNAASLSGGLIGSPAPEFALKSIDGSTVQLSELRGKALMVNFWATWCPPCKEEMPVLQSAYEKYRDEGFEFVGIDMKEDEATVRNFVEEGGYSWTFLLDSDGQVSNSYRVVGVPTTYFIDREGIIQGMFIGAISKSVLESKLDSIK